MMNDAFLHVAQYIAVAFAGCVLAGIYFGGLWWTVCRLPDSRRPWGLYFGSLFVRLTVILTGFYLLLANGNWSLIAVSLLAFLSTRALLVYCLGHLPVKSTLVEKTV